MLQQGKCVFRPQTGKSCDEARIHPQAFPALPLFTPRTPPGGADGTFGFLAADHARRPSKRRSRRTSLHQAVRREHSEFAISGSSRGLGAGLPRGSEKRYRETTRICLTGTWTSSSSVAAWVGPSSSVRLRCAPLQGHPHPRPPDPKMRQLGGGPSFAKTTTGSKESSRLKRCAARIERWPSWRCAMRATTTTATMMLILVLTRVTEREEGKRRGGEEERKKGRRTSEG